MFVGHAQAHHVDSVVPAVPKLPSFEVELVAVVAHTVPFLHSHASGSRLGSLESSEVGEQEDVPFPFWTVFFLLLEVVE